MILYNVTFVDKLGLRTIVGPAQGRFMKKTREEAEQYLKDLIANNDEDRILSIYGQQSKGTFRVDPFDCYDHGDPKGIYVDD